MTGTTFHPTLGQARYSVMQLPSGPDDQVGRTIGVMRERVNEDAARPEFQQWTAQICGNPAQSEMDAVRQAWGHVRNAISFQRDESTGAGVGGYPESEVIEVIIRPVDMARYISQGVAIGDCDDFSMLLACMLTCYGIPVDFVTVAADGRAPNQFSHVYVAAYPMDEETGQRVRIPLDASHGSYPGWEVPNYFGRLQQWPVSSSCNLLTFALLGAAGYLAYNWLKEAA